MRKTSQSGGRFSPSLNALHSFEAAARLQSLTRAAEELNVTVSAVAFQVRQVEQALGTKLVGRSGRALEVSAAGARLASELAGPFEAIRQTTDRFRASDAAAQVVTISMLTSFASMWLLPRLPELEAACPDLELRISTGARRVRLLSEGVDCAIRCGEGRWEGLDAIPLFPQILAPICHPSYLAKAGALLAPAELERHSLVVNRDRPTDWEEWLARLGLSALAPAAIHYVEGRELALAAVRSGLGIGLLDAPMLARELRAGELVQVLDPVLDSGWSHCFVTPSGHRLSKACRTFRDWIVEAASSE